MAAMKPRLPWCEQSIERMAKLWTIRTSKDIADILSREFKRKFTRNAVIGKGTRLHLPQKVALPRRVSSCRTKASSKSYLPPSEPTPLPLRVCTVPDHHKSTFDPNRTGITLEAAQDANGCRWPVTHAHPHLFCGETVERGPYCPDHRSRAWRASGVRE